MHREGEAQDPTRTAPAQLHRLRSLVEQGDAEGFAKGLNLDAGQTRQWFDDGFPHEGYGAEVLRALGTLVLSRIVAKRERAGRAHG